VPHPTNACSELENLDEIAEENLHRTFLLATRGDCMFVQKARHAEAAGLAGAVIMGVFIFLWFLLFCLYINHKSHVLLTPI